MNRKVLFALPLSLLLVSCASDGGASNGGVTTAACKTQKAWFCRGDPAVPTVTVNTRNGQLRVNPGCVKAAGKSMLIFRLTPGGNMPMGAVEIVPKNKAHSWLTGKNDEYQDLIMIDVPDKTPADSYHYGIVTDTDCLDPRVRVEPPG